MAKRVTRKYVMTKRLDIAYKNYKKQYKAKQKSMQRRGMEMESRMLKKSEYLNVRGAFVKEGMEKNINRNIVEQQAYVYSYKTGKHLRKWAKEMGMEESMAEIRKGKGLSGQLADLNVQLRELHPEWTGKQRQEFISFEVFGSE